MDMCYDTILVYGGEKLRLYREVRFVHSVFETDQPRNHPIYAIDQYFGCFQLSSNQIHETQVKIEDLIEGPVPNQTNVWKLFFDVLVQKIEQKLGSFNFTRKRKYHPIMQTRLQSYR